MEEEKYISTIVYILEDGDRIGYALTRLKKYDNIESIRMMSTFLVPACYNLRYGVSKDRRDYSKDFSIDKNMCDILEERYSSYYYKGVGQVVADVKIKDLKYRYANIKTNEKSPSLDLLLEKFKESKDERTGVTQDLYTEKMKEKIPDIEDITKKYYYVKVKYVDIYDDYSKYSYISEDETVKVGDRVVVDRAGKITVALVTDANWYLGSLVPYPVKMTKKVIKKIESDDELKEYGLIPEQFVIHEWYDKDEYYSYIRITTFSSDKSAIAKISVKLIESKLCASTHTDKILSSYWWDGKIVDTEEYRLEIISRMDKKDEIVKVIRELHDYEVPEIQIDEHKTLNIDIEKWIDDILDGKF